MRTFAFIALLFGVAFPAAAQYGYFPEQPEAVSVEDLARTPGRYHEKAVLVRGKLGFGMSFDMRVHVLEDPDSFASEILMAEPYMAAQQLQFLGASELEVEGWFFSTRMLDEYTARAHPILRNYPFDPAWIQSIDRRSEGFLAVVSVVPVGASNDLAEERGKEARAEMEIGDAIQIAPGSVPAVSLHDLLAAPDPFLGRRVEVVGKFRGNNLFGDLSIQDKRTPRDFVIKTADDAIWVTGMRPAGKGFRLDPKRRRDTGEWIRVFGRPWMSDGMVFLRAERLELAEHPENPDLEPLDLRIAEDEAREATAAPLRVVFSLPLDGERAIPLDSQFRVQFSNRMDPASFNASVDLLYENDWDANPFPDLEVTYDAANRTMLVVPNSELEPDRDVFLLLYKEIRDEHGQALEAQPDAAAWDEDAVRVLRFRTASS